MSKPFVPLAIVHHANQFLITNGYDNRTDLATILGPTDASSGLRAILDLHAQYDVPFHLHVSGTLIEACAWYDPLFLKEIADLRESGLIEIIGSTYAQNIMTLFDQEHNYYQIQEELRLINKWLDVPPSDISGFWVPERVWNTEQLVDILTDNKLDNGGYKYTLVDDRLFLPKAARDRFDKEHTFNPEMFEAYYIQDGKDLIGLPLSIDIRLNLLFDHPENEQNLNVLMDQLLKEVQNGRDVIAIYGDDMEKAAAIPPWNGMAIEQYRCFLKWLIKRNDVKPVFLQEWLMSSNIRSPIPLGPGTYKELEKDFGAGEDYMGWATSEKWLPYQEMINNTWSKLLDLSSRMKKESPLLELARKHLLACTYETGWHDAPNSIHTDLSVVTKGNSIIGSPAPWACTLASHARASHVLLKAVEWEQDNNPHQGIWAYVEDIDGDGYEELILRNEACALVITPQYGGRIVYMFSFSDDKGALVIGNPTDDWNWLSELNDFMDIPINHPGALADVGFEHDSYKVASIDIKESEQVEIVLVNNQKNSAAFGMIKRFSLKKGERQVQVRYENIPSNILPLSIDFGLSPDYLRLLREGRSKVVPYSKTEKRGFKNGDNFTWVQSNSADSKWDLSRNPIFGHGFSLTKKVTSPTVSLSLGVDLA
ncbi:hypothetical protein [Peribacillus alkalitolerans]|uniref:hypothetical protein n=1 Tax=Peribacillus alkalitolerans TaxID=1550385 RepID=UPI0013D86736|nr:hypothetical protein [Peribacillus alkalitolerans]